MLSGRAGESRGLPVCILPGPRCTDDRWTRRGAPSAFGFHLLHDLCRNSLTLGWRETSELVSLVTYSGCPMHKPSGDFHMGHFSTNPGFPQVVAFEVTRKWLESPARLEWVPTAGSHRHSGCLAPVARVTELVVGKPAAPDLGELNQTAHDSKSQPFKEGTTTFRNM